MAVNIPPQRHRCAKHAWCLARGQAHRVHVGEVHVLATARGTEFRVSLTAEQDEDPVVHVEASFDGSSPVMELGQLDAGEAIELAGFLLRLARVAQVSGKQMH